MNLGLVLGNTFYPRFVPKNVSRFTIPGYKVQTIGAGEVPGKQLQIANLQTKKVHAASFSELHEKMVTETEYIYAMASWGWNLIERDGKGLTFEKASSDSPKS